MGSDSIPSDAALKRPSATDHDGRSSAVGAFGWPKPLEWAFIAIAAIVVFGYAPVTVQRTVASGFGDVQVFFRAAWAIWSGYPLYDVTDHHGWSYHYPPTLALLLRPFADPLPGHPQLPWTLSYPAAIATWYLIGALALVLSLHVWAQALERHAHLRVRAGYWQAWWYLRLTPLLVLLLYVMDGLDRGQPTSLVLLCMVAFLALYCAQRPYAAAFALALGIALKLFPALLLLLLLLRRDWKCLFAVALCCTLILFVLPLALLGAPTTFDLYRVLWIERLSGILGGAPTARVAAEISFLSYDMLSTGAMLARIVAGGVPSQNAPLPGWATMAQDIVSVAMIGALIYAGRGRVWTWRGDQPAIGYAHLVAGAVLLAALPTVLPTSQPNYGALALPLLAVLTIEVWRKRGRIVLSPAIFAVAVFAWFAFAETEFPIWQPLRVIGLETPLFLGLFAWGIVVLNGLPRPYLTSGQPPSFSGRNPSSPGTVSTSL